MASLELLPAELALQIIAHLRMPELESLAYSCSRLWNASLPRLREHRRLQRRYRKAVLELPEFGVFNLLADCLRSECSSYVEHLQIRGGFIQDWVEQYTTVKQYVEFLKLPPLPFTEEDFVNCETPIRRSLERSPLASHIDVDWFMSLLANGNEDAAFTLLLPMLQGLKHLSMPGSILRPPNSLVNTQFRSLQSTSIPHSMPHSLGNLTYFRLTARPEFQPLDNILTALQPVILLPNLRTLDLQQVLAWNYPSNLKLGCLSSVSLVHFEGGRVSKQAMYAFARHFRGPCDFYNTRMQGPHWSIAPSWGHLEIPQTGALADEWKLTERPVEPPEPVIVHLMRCRATVQ